MKAIKYNGKKKLTLDEISKLYRIDNYTELANFVIENINNGAIKPIKSSKTNGKNPTLYNAYRVIQPELDNSQFIDELRYKLNSTLKLDYYINNLEKYKEDREYIICLSNYVESHKELLLETVSLNERSFEIWGREKFLQKEGGIRIIKNLGLDLDRLNIYETTEPLSYYSHHKNIPQNVLILENKDTFYSMRRHLLNGNEMILGLPIGTLIYGKGKGISKSFKDFTYCVEPYLSDESNQIFYFGDLDYEGILIYEILCKIFEDKTLIKPFLNAYSCMLKKANKDLLPYTKEGQNKNIGSYFLDAFEEKERTEIIDILNMNKYIPQEILSSRDF